MNHSHPQLSEIFKQNRIVEEHPSLAFRPTLFPSVYRHSNHPFLFEEQIFEELQKTAIIQDYFPTHTHQYENMEIEEEEERMPEQQPYLDLTPFQRQSYQLSTLNLLDSESSGRQLPSRNSSVSSFTSQSQKSSNLSFSTNHKHPKMQIQRSNSHLKMRLQIKEEKKLIKNRREVGSSTQKRQRLNKIKKVQEIGCNCKKSKCLKMYCQCFNLQILCGQNCNCVGCGNITQNQTHQKAVLDALTRNPKAFTEDLAVVDTAFQLGVELSEVRKGCKCRKTQCKKKYCECYNSGVGCGIFCQCQQCENKV